MKNARFRMAIAAVAILNLVFPFLFVQPAAAYTTAYVLSTPTIQSGVDHVALGTLYFSVTGSSVKDGDTVSISLPPCVELNKFTILPGSTAGNTVTVNVDRENQKFTASNGSNSSYTKDYGEIADRLPTAGGVKVQVTDDNRFTFIVDWSTAQSYYYVSFPDVNVKPLGPDDAATITATIDAPPGSGFSVPSSAPVLANVAVGGTTASVDAPYATTDGQPVVPVLGESGGDIANIIIKENGSGALETDGTVELALDPGFTWTDVNIALDWGFMKHRQVSVDPAPKEYKDDVEYVIDNDSDASGQSILKFTINRSTDSSAGRITVSAGVEVDEDVAQAGTVMVNYQGTNQGVNEALLTVAKYALSGVAVSEETSTDVIAGRLDQRLGQLSVVENTPGDLPKDRTISFTLPTGAKWHTYPTVAKEAGDGEITFMKANSDKDVLRYKVTETSSVRSSFIFKYGSVDLALDAPDVIEVTLGGSAGASGTEAVASVIQPVKLSVADKNDVKIGRQQQAIGDLTIKEAVAGALRAKDPKGDQALLTLKLPEGVVFSEKPAVAVSGGNLSLDTTGIRLDLDDRMLDIPIDKSSSSASTIKVTGVLVDVDRTVAEGDLELETAGTAISETADIFQDSFDKLDLLIANCVTPAPTEIVGVAVFGIDKQSYTLNGQEMPIDVAPYIKDGRAMIPLRFAANAIGVADSNIVWDGETGAVTMIKGNRIVQMQIGSNSLQINGIAVATDASPEISNGRTMMPIRALGTALGASLEWNEADRTVTIKSS